MREVTVGIVGAGVITNNVHLPVLHATPGVTIAWVADVNETLAASVAADNQVPIASLDGGVAALPAADIILLAIPLPPRGAYLEHFHGTKTALLVEKPLSNTVAEHRNLVETFPDWQLSVGYQRRFYATFGLVRSIIESGALGALTSISVNEGGRTTKTGGAGQYQSLPVARGGGLVKNLGCHSLDLAIWLTGATGFEIANRSIAWDGETDQACQAKIVLTRPGGAPVDLHVAYSWIDNMVNAIRFEFANAVLVAPVSPSTSVDLQDLNGKSIAKLATSVQNGGETTIQAFYLEWQATIDAFVARSPQPISAASTLLCAELMDALLARGGSN